MAGGICQRLGACGRENIERSPQRSTRWRASGVGCRRPDARSRRARRAERRASQGVTSAALGGFKAVVRAGNPLTEKARAQARRDTHMPRVMGSGIAGARAKALARNPREARVGSLHAGSKRWAVGTGRALARHRDQILGPRQPVGGFEIAALGLERAAHGDGEPELRACR